MKYRLVYTHRAIRDIDTLDPSIKQRIGKTLLRNESDPLQHRVVFDMRGMRS